MRNKIKYFNLIWKTSPRHCLLNISLSILVLYEREVRINAIVLKQPVSYYLFRKSWHQNLEMKMDTLLTPLSWIFIEKITGSQLAKKFTSFYGPRMLIIAFKGGRQLSLSWTRLISSMHPIPRPGDPF